MSRKRLTAADASLIWAHYQQAGDLAAKALTTTRGYSVWTFYRIIRNQGNVPGLYLHPRHQMKWTALQKAQVAQIIAANPAFTLHEIIAEAVQQGLPRIGLSTLQRYLKVLLITRKMMRTIPQMRNAPPTKHDRKLYCEWVLANQHLTFIYIDEFGFQIGTQRRFGRAPRGQPAQRITPLTRSANVSVCLAVSAAHGLIYYDVNNGAFDRESFGIFIDSLAEEVAGRQIANACFIMDNCAIHNVYDVAEACDIFDCDFNYLPPYSPMLNPIEGCIGDVKRAIETAFATALRPRLLALATLPYGQRTRQREQLLLQALTNALQVVTPQLVQAHEHHMMGQFPQMLAQQDV
jgi:transposase